MNAARRRSRPSAKSAQTSSGWALVPFAGLSAAYFAHIGFFNPYLSLWLKERGYGVAVIGLLTAVQASTRLFAPYAWGWLSDHTGERVRLLRYSAAAALLASLGLWLDMGLLGLLVVLVLMFAHTSAMMPMSEAAMAHLVSRDGAFDVRRYGRVRLWGSLGFLITVLAAGAWFERFGMRHFPGWALATIAAVVCSTWLLPDLREEAHAPAAPRKPVWPILRQPAVAWFFASVFFQVLAHFAVYVFYSLYLDSLGFGKTLIGFLWAWSVLAEIAWFFTQGRWLPRLSLAAWLVVCALAMLLRMGLTLSNGLGFLLCAQTLHALSFAAHHTVCIAVLSRHFPGRLRGRGQALYSVIGYGFPGLIGALGGGALSSRYGLVTVYWAALAVSALALLCAARAWRLRHHPHPLKIDEVASPRSGPSSSAS